MASNSMLGRKQAEYHPLLLRKMAHLAGHVVLRHGGKWWDFDEAWLLSFLTVPPEDDQPSLLPLTAIKHKTTLRDTILIFIPSCPAPPPPCG